MTVELPKDAEGREIPLDVDALYDKNGERLAIYAWEYIPKLEHIKWMVRFLFDESGVKYYPDEYFLTPPDSWEKLLDDLDRVVENKSAFYATACAYMNQGGSTCNCCRLHGHNTRSCTDEMFKDVVSRIRKLRGEDE